MTRQLFTQCSSRPLCCPWLTCFQNPQSPVFTQKIKILNHHQGPSQGWERYETISSKIFQPTGFIEWLIGVIHKTTFVCRLYLDIIQTGFLLLCFKNSISGGNTQKYTNCQAPINPYQKNLAFHLNRLRAWCVDAVMEATLTEHLSRLILASLTIFLSFVSLSECFDFSRFWANQGRSAGIITHWCPNQNGTSQLSDYCLIFVWAPFVIKSWFNELKFMIYAFCFQQAQYKMWAVWYAGPSSGSYLLQGR